MDKYLLSVVIPLYNNEVYIKDLLSLFTANHKDIEIIVVEDFSRDHSLNVVLEFFNTLSYNVKKKFKLIKHSVNLGLSSARNSGLLAAEGKYVYFLDADDSLNIGLLIFLLNNLDHDNEIIHFGYIKFINEFPNIEDNSETYQTENHSSISGEFFLSNQLKQNAFESPVWQRCYKRNYLISNNYFFKIGLLHEDEEWSIRVIVNANRVLDLSKYLIYFYRVNNVSITNDSSKNLQRSSDLQLIAKTNIQEFKYLEVDENLKKLILDYYIRLYLFSFNLDPDIRHYDTLFALVHSYLYKTLFKSLYLAIKKALFTIKFWFYLR